jgi:hypothetical protein
MQLTPRDFLTQCSHALQQSLLPSLECEIGPLSPALRRIAAVAAIVPLGRWVGGRRAPTGRPAKDRAALVTAFIAKAVLNLNTTRDLIGRLKAEPGLRQLCGWRMEASIPHESKFSRAFAEFAGMKLPEHLHAAVIEATQKDRLIGHIARDSTAIEARERFAESKPKAKKKKKPGRPKKPKGSHARAKASERGTRIQRQRGQKLETMLRDLPKNCDIGAKKNSKGHEHYWRGYKLHLDVADGQIPISAVLTSASVHDSQVAIPLMTMTGERVTHLYELMDSAYDADAILMHSREKGHVPIVDPHGRRGTKKASQLLKAFPTQATPQLSPAEKQRYKERTMVERVNARLKDEFGGSRIRVRGAAKVMAHLMFGVLALTVDQWLRLAPPG